MSWGGIVVPKGTPQPIIDKLNAAMNKALRTDTVQASMSKLGAVPAAGTPADFRALVASEQVKYRDLIESANIQKLD